jgi:single-strand DNA-binding protein
MAANRRKGRRRLQQLGGSASDGQLGLQLGDPAAAQSLSKGSRVAVVGRLQQRSWTAEDRSARTTIEVVADELGPSLRWATATPVRATSSASDSTPQQRPVRGA